MAAVEGEVDLFGRQELDLESRQQPPRCDQRAAAPFQQVDVQIRGSLGQRVKERANRIGQPVGRPALVIAFAGKHLDAEIEIPPDQHHAAARLQQRLAQGTKIVLAVDNEGQPFRRRDSPAVPARSKLGHLMSSPPLVCRGQTRQRTFGFRHGA